MSFSLRSIVLSLVLLAGLAPAESKPTQGLRYPSLTPDGKSVAFGYRGDIWIAPVDGKGRAERLTIHEAQDTLPRVSPDGKQIAFSSKRNGNYDLFVIPVDGGMPKQITFHSAQEILCNWSPDGTKLLFISDRDLGPGRLDIYEVALEGGTPRRITKDGGREGSYSPDGTRIVYVRGFNSIYWDNYKGSAAFDIYVVDSKGGVPRQVTFTDGNERFPYFSADGKSIYFVAEEEGVANFYAIPVEGGERRKVTQYKNDDVHRPDFGWDGKEVVFELVGKLYTSNLAAPAAKPTEIPLSIKSDVRNSGIERRTLTAGGEQVDVSADGTSVAFTLRGDLWVMPASGGKGKRVTSGPAKDEWPRFSPDGSKLAYFSNARGNPDIFLLDLKTEKPSPLTSHKAKDFYHAWAPDGKTIVFSSDRTGNREIWTIDVETKQTTQLTNDPAADDDPCFSADGKWIAFDSGRSGAQGIYVMKADGSDVRSVAQGAGFYQVPSFSPDGKFLVYEGMNPTGGSQGLFVVAVAGGQSMKISGDGSTARWSPAGDYIYFIANRGGNGIFRVPAPKGVAAGERVPFIGELQVDRRKELQTLFDEAWLALKSGFYDKKMHGVDWNALKKKYRGMAIDAENKDEFHNIIRQLLGELGASHLGIWGGTRGSSVAPSVKQNGYLGFELEEQSLADGSRKIERVVAKSPADKAGLRIGDVLIQLNKKKLKADTNLDELLAGTVGKKVPVTYRPISEAGLGEERTVELDGLPAGKLRELLYDEWVAICKRRVKEGTKSKEGRVGYVHLNSMNPKNLQRFTGAVRRWNRNKKIEGMILDVRNNGGGNIHLQLMDVLTAKPLAIVQARGREKMIQPAMYWDRPCVLLINERSFSDAEVFPFMFKEAKVGTVIGVPTAGGVIGTQNITLSDGSNFRIPQTGFWSLDGTRLEGLGVKPDIYVAETPEDRLEGRDPQLARAIAVVMEQVKEWRAKKKAKEKEAEEKKAEENADPKKEETADPKPAEPKAKPAAVDAPPHPIFDAEEGEWVRFKAIAPNGNEVEMKERVVDVSDDEVTLQRTVFVEGGSRELPARPRPRSQVLKPLNDAEATYSTDTVKVGDATLKCVVMTFEADGAESKVWICPQVTVTGVVRVERDGVVVLELLEWGKDD